LQFAILLFIFSIITATLLYYTIRLKHRKAKIIEVYNTERRISKKIHDELANDIFNVMSFAEAQDFTVPGKQEKLVQNLDAVYSKTRDISRENNSIDTSANFGDALKQMLGDYGSETVNVMVINHEVVDWESMSEDKKITLYRVLQEFMVNMKKHSMASIAAVKFTNAGKNIYVQYTDNGKGLDPEKLFYKNGLQNAENRILSIGGSITFENTTNGLKIVSTIPV
jgi:signal transduction histidine kinase